MSYKSQAQAKWAHSDAGTKALGGAEKVEEWDMASKGMKLPAKVGKAPPKLKAPLKGRPSMGGKGWKHK